MFDLRFAATGAACFLGFCVVVGSSHAAAADRVGSETCRSCHASAYETWKASAHAKAADSLSAPQRQDLRCLHCHAPELARVIQEGTPFQGADRSATHAESGVSCESCHGPGQYYTPAYVMRDAELSRAIGLNDPGRKSCLGCHTSDAPSISPFDFAAKVKLIDHWTQDRTPAELHRPARAGAAEPFHGRSPALNAGEPLVTGR